MFQGRHLSDLHHDQRATLLQVLLLHRLVLFHFLLLAAVLVEFEHLVQRHLILGHDLVVQVWLNEPGDEHDQLNDYEQEAPILVVGGVVLVGTEAGRPDLQPKHGHEHGWDEELDQERPYKGGGDVANGGTARRVHLRAQHLHIHEEYIIAPPCAPVRGDTRCGEHPHSEDTEKSQQANDQPSQIAG